MTNFHYQNNHYWLIMIFWCIICVSKPTYSQDIFQSFLDLSAEGIQFLPNDMFIQLISSNYVDSVASCALACNANPLCGIFDYDAMEPNQCRLFEGDPNTSGSIVSSSMSNSQVGFIRILPALFTEYEQPCTLFCVESRYLTCIEKFGCDCTPHTYWDPTVRMCRPQMITSGSSCQTGMNMCREDLNLTCSRAGQCEGVDSS